jgi:hypothetical protein
MCCYSVADTVMGLVLGHSPVQHEGCFTALTQVRVGPAHSTAEPSVAGRQSWQVDALSRDLTWWHSLLCPEHESGTQGHPAPVALCMQPAHTCMHPLALHRPRPCLQSGCRDAGDVGAMGRSQHTQVQHGREIISINVRAANVCWTTSSVVHICRQAHAMMCAVGLPVNWAPVKGRDTLPTCSFLFLPLPLQWRSEVLLQLPGGFSPHAPMGLQTTPAGHHNCAAQVMALQCDANQAGGA